MISREDQTRITAVHYVSGSNTALFEIAISLGRIADMLAEMNGYIVEYGEHPIAAEAHNAKPVRHGKWIDMDEQSYTWKVRCSVCGHERSMLSTQGEYPNYCENCGARMDEE